jgi:hypothetical protein
MRQPGAERTVTKQLTEQAVAAAQELAQLATAHSRCTLLQHFAASSKALQLMRCCGQCLTEAVAPLGASLCQRLPNVSTVQLRATGELDVLFM